MGSGAPVATERDMPGALNLAAVRSQFAAHGRRALRMDVTPTTVAAATESRLAELRSEVTDLALDALDSIDGLQRLLRSRLRRTAPLAGAIRSARWSLEHAREQLAHGRDSRGLAETRNTVLHVVLDLERNIANAIGRPSFMTSTQTEYASHQRRAARQRVLQGLRDALDCSRINGTRARIVALVLGATLREAPASHLSLDERAHLRRLVEACLRASLVADPLERRAALRAIMDDIGCFASTVEAQLHDDALAVAA